MTAYRVLVTGSRTWSDRGLVYYQLNEARNRAVHLGHDRLVVVHGACPRGADRMASDWTYVSSVLDDVITVIEERHPAEWGRYGKGAGPLRNAAMVAAGADECLAFIRAASPGASHCAALAARASVPVRRWAA